MFQGMFKLRTYGYETVLKAIITVRRMDLYVCVDAKEKFLYVYVIQCGDHELSIFYS